MKSNTVLNMKPESFWIFDQIWISTTAIFTFYFRFSFAILMKIDQPVFVWSRKMVDELLTRLSNIRLCYCFFFLRPISSATTLQSDTRPSGYRFNQHLDFRLFLRHGPFVERLIQVPEEVPNIFSDSMFKRANKEQEMPGKVGIEENWDINNYNSVTPSKD